MGVRKKCLYCSPSCKLSCLTQKSSEFDNFHFISCLLRWKWTAFRRTHSDRQTGSLSLLPHCTGPLSLSLSLSVDEREKHHRRVSISPYLLLSQRSLRSSSGGGWSSRRSPYEVLGVTRSASPKDIKIAYFREAKKSHPDLHPGDAAATRRFQEVSAAYELLSDPKRKAMFDATGWAGQNVSIRIYIHI